VQTQGSESGSGKSDSRKYSCLQGRFSTVTVGPGLTKPNEALPSQRNNSQEGRQISTDSYNYNRDNPKNIKGLQQDEPKFNQRGYFKVKQQKLYQHKYYQ
jgi:hypothetical protein